MALENVTLGLEICAECGLPIYPNEPSYYQQGPEGNLGSSFHSGCGDPFGTKAKDSRIQQLQSSLRELLAIFGRPHASEWLNNEAYEAALEAYERARALIPG